MFIHQFIFYRDILWHYYCIVLSFHIFGIIEKPVRNYVSSNRAVIKAWELGISPDNYAFAPWLYFHRKQKLMENITS